MISTSSTTTINNIRTLSTGELEHIMQLALRAPSVADRKPWQFRIVGNVVELYATSNGEVVSSKRLKYVSGGALLQYIRLIIRNRGRKEIIQLFPRLDNPELIAYIRLNGDYNPTAEERNLYKVLQGRPKPELDQEKWCREFFQEAIQNVGKQTGCEITLFNEELYPELTGKLDRYVEAQKSANMQAISELANEMNLKKASGKTDLERLCSFNNAEFREGTIHCGSERVDESSRCEYVLISADVENSYSWINAGEAMARINLYLKRCGLFGMAIVPIIEDPEARAWLAEKMPGNTWPQVLVKLGRISKVVDQAEESINNFIRKPGL